MILNGRADSQYKQRQMNTHRDKRTRTPEHTIDCLPPELLHLVCSFYQYPEDGWRRPRGRGEAYDDIRDNQHARRTAVWLLNRHWYSIIRLVHREWSTLYPKDLTCFLTYPKLCIMNKVKLSPLLINNITCLVVDDVFLTGGVHGVPSIHADKVQFMQVKWRQVPFSWRVTTKLLYASAIYALPKYAQLRELALPDELTMTTNMFNAVAQLVLLTHLKTPPCEADPCTKTNDNGLSILVARLSKLVFLEFTHLVSPFKLPDPGLPHLERLILWTRIDAGIEYLGPHLPSLNQLTIRGLHGFESEIDQLKGIRTLPKKVRVLIDLDVSMDWFPTNSEFRNVYSSWYEIYVGPLCEILGNVTGTRVVIKHVDDTLHLWTTRGTNSPADKKEHQRVLRFGLAV